MRKRGVFSLVAAGLAALITAAPADSQTAKKTAGKEIALEICRMKTFADAFDIFQVRRFRREKLLWSIPPTLKKQRFVCEYWTGRKS
jgi:hypothetical protein